jgi:hypothetical protein
MNGNLVDFFRSFRGDFLDIHPAFRASHQHHALRSAVDDCADIKFVRNVYAFFNKDSSDGCAFRPGLRSYQLHAKDLPCVMLDFLQRFHDLYSTALATAACVNLRLDNPD